MPEGSSPVHRSSRTSQQDALRRARQALEDAITLPAGDRQRWCTNLLVALQKVRRIFRLHVLESEADDGSLNEVLTIKPQLGRKVVLLRGEHGALREEIAVLCARVVEQIDSADPDTDVLRLDSRKIVDRLLLHQAKGSDLLYEAFIRIEGGEG
jgi:hypothetical protein